MSRPPCSHCGIALLFRYCWQTFADGTRHIRAECAACCRYHHFAPQTPEVVAEADANPSSLPVRPVARGGTPQQGSLFGDES